MEGNRGTKERLADNVCGWRGQKDHHIGWTKLRSTVKNRGTHSDEAQKIISMMLSISAWQNWTQNAATRQRVKHSPQGKVGN